MFLMSVTLASAGQHVCVCVCVCVPHVSYISFGLSTLAEACVCVYVFLMSVTSA